MTRRTRTAVLAGMAAIACAALAQGAAAAPNLTGSAGPDRLTGSPRADRMVGGGGGDVLLAGAGADVVMGGAGGDSIAGGPGRDRLLGGPGNDRIAAADGQRDVVACGPGEDVALVDPIDRTSGCETVAGDSEGGTPHLDAVEDALHALPAGLEGTAWARTSGNAVRGVDGKSWLLQTPDCWGQEACTDSVGIPRIQQTIRANVAAARSRVDVTTLYPFPDDGFLTSIALGIRDAYAAGNRPLVRVLAGNPPVVGDTTGINTDRFRDAVLAQVGKPYDKQVRLAVSDYVSYYPLSWNHSKILAVDGQTLITGGHNYWGSSYLQQTDPVNDVSMRAEGPVATAAQTYTDYLWQYVCKQSFLKKYLSTTKTVGSCPSSPPSPGPAFPAGDVEMLSVGELGIRNPVPASGGASANARNVAREHASSLGPSVYCPSPFDDRTNDPRFQPDFDRANAGKLAQRTLVASATRSVTISQQDVLGPTGMPSADDRMFEAIGGRIAAGVQVTIVTSTDGAAVPKGSTTGTYSNGWTPQDVAGTVLRATQRVAGDADAARAAVCRNLRVATIRNSDAPTWPNGNSYANHAKVIAVDDAAFYVGSENVYPAWLQEFGVITENADAAATFRTQYLDPLWRYSRATAVVDAEQGRCDLG